VSSVVFLPVAVFFRAYSLAFMAQAGPEWDLLVVADPNVTAH
jgi:hypothetical protein